MIRRITGAVLLGVIVGAGVVIAAAVRRDPYPLHQDRLRVVQ